MKHAVDALLDTNVKIDDNSFDDINQPYIS